MVMYAESKSFSRVQAVKLRGRKGKCVFLMCDLCYFQVVERRQQKCAFSFIDHFSWVIIANYAILIYLYTNIIIWPPVSWKCIFNSKIIVLTMISQFYFLWIFGVKWIHSLILFCFPIVAAKNECSKTLLRWHCPGNQRIADNNCCQSVYQFMKLNRFLTRGSTCRTIPIFHSINFGYFREKQNNYLRFFSSIDSKENYILMITTQIDFVH